MTRPRSKEPGDLLRRALENLVCSTLMASQLISFSIIDGAYNHTSDSYGVDVRGKFHDLCAESTPPKLDLTHHLPTGITQRMLINTCLWFRPTSIEFVLYQSRTFDDMRILAFEADYPVPGCTYPDDYHGYLWEWVRLQQICFNFF